MGDMSRATDASRPLDEQVNADRMTVNEAVYWLQKYILGAADPDVRSYGQDVLGHPDRYVWFLKHLITLGEVRHSEVLDVGCGYAWEGMLLSVLGSNRVLGVDIRQTSVDAAQGRIREMAEFGLRSQVDVIAGDICSLDLGSEAFDVVFSSEAIEHVHDLETMVARCWRLLKRGGRMIVTDSNNALNPRVRRKIMAMWEDRERSSDYCARLAEERADAASCEPYAVMRQRIVSASNPKLTDAAVERVVAATAGMVKPDIAALAATYTDSVTLPEPPSLSRCRCPVTGEYAERLLDPYAVRKIFANQGFRRVTVRHAFRRIPLRVLNAVTVPALSKVLFRLKPQFIVMGVKP